MPTYAKRSAEFEGARLLEFALSEPRHALILPRRVEHVNVKVERRADPVRQRRVIGQVVIGQRMDQRTQAGFFDRPRDHGAGARGNVDFELRDRVRTHRAVAHPADEQDRHLVLSHHFGERAAQSLGREALRRLVIDVRVPRRVVVVHCTIPSRIKLSPDAVIASSFDRNCHPSTSRALALLASPLIPSLGTASRASGLKIATIRTSQSGNWRNFALAAFSPRFARKISAISNIDSAPPATARKRWFFAAGSVIALTCIPATSRTSTAPR